MSDVWLDITDIPASGREFSFSDPSLWTGPIAEFSLPYVPASDAPLTAELFVRPEGRGVLARGALTGAIVAPCDRCAEDARIGVNENFELFEEAPVPGEESVEPGLLRRRGKVLELNVSALLWEQFLLALPVKPLCREDCRGLCPGCGRNLNAEACECAGDEGDPRLAALRNMKLSPKGK